MATEAEHLAAVKALLTTMGAKPHTAQDLSELGAAPAYYTEVMVMQRLSSGPRRLSLPSEATQWRILTRAVGQRYANAQLMRANSSKLHEASLTVAGETFYVERSIPDDPIGKDDDWFSGISEFIY